MKKWAISLIFQNQITINGYSYSTPITIQLFNEFGAVISKKETLKSNTIDISNLAAGTYYCRIYTENSYILKKIVKL
ncbi:MAG: T9SS type A sorting domain-containing protein [Fluviicola sp.]